MEIFSRICINSFNIMNFEYKSIGVGIYLEASIFDHSCSPTAAVVFRGKKIAVRCISNPFKNLEFKDLRISYTDVSRRSKERRKILRDQYYFECDCTECDVDPFHLDEMKRSSFRCPTCDTCNIYKEKEEEDEDVNPGEIRLEDLCLGADASLGAAMLGAEASATPFGPGSGEEKKDKIFRCYSCNAEVPKYYISEYVEVRQRTLATLFGGNPTNPNPNLSRASEFEIEMGRTFHPCDRLYLDVLEECLGLHIDAQNWNRALKTGAEMAMAYTVLYPSKDVNTALLYLKMAKLKNQVPTVKRLEEALDYFRKALEILAITHGEDHALVKDHCALQMASVQMELQMRKSGGTRIGGKVINGDKKATHEEIMELLN